MKLILKNFRCHEDREIDIAENSDTGIALISGASGQGKSSVLNAIAYAFFGQVKKPYSFGKTSCEVTLEYGPLSITRRAKPYSLVVIITRQGTSGQGGSQDKFEGDQAQLEIERVLGMNHDEFYASSYMVQNVDSSVISLIPSEQLRLVEMLANSGSASSGHMSKQEIREKLRMIVDANEDHKERLDAQIGLLTKQIAEKDKNLKTKGLNPEKKIDELKSELEGLVSRAETLKTKLRKKEENLDELKKNDNTDLETKVAKLQAEIEGIKELRDKLIPVNDESITALEAEIEAMKAYKEYLDEKKRLSEMKEAYFQEIQEKIDEAGDFDAQIQDLEGKRKAIKTELSQISTSSTYDVKKKSIEDRIGRGVEVTSNNIYRIISQLSKKRKKTEVKLHEIRDKISKIKLAGGIFISVECPDCSATLALLGGDEAELVHPPETERKIDEEKLAKWDATLKEFSDKVRDLSQLERDCIELKAIIPKGELPNKKGLEDKLEKINKELCLCEERKQKRDEMTHIIESKELPPSILSIQKKVEKLKTAKVDIALFDEKQQELEDARHSNSERSKYKEMISKKKKRLSELQASFTQKEDGVGTKENKETLINSISAINEELHSSHEKIQSLSKTLNGYSEYERVKEETEKLKKDRIKLEIELRDVDHDLVGAYEVEALSKKAEVLAIESIVDQINERSRPYLERMFDEPISVRLETVKVLKTKKTETNKMNTVIEYKGNVYDSVSQLSGGERQRINLSFLLAVSDVLGSKIMLLDECLNNLDAETNSSLINYLKEIGHSKLILVVSHESINGIFDEVVEI